MSVRTRFAPSPTGYLHVGGARTALFNWLFARANAGKFVLRVEDTDAARNTDAAREAIFDGLGWLGLDWDEGPRKLSGEGGPYFQSERGEIYDRWFEKLRESGRVYADGEAWRFRFQRKEITMHDLVCGEVTIDYRDESNTPDMVVRRSDGSYVFHFVNVVDDLEMRISHVIRGEDHLMNTPKHLQLIEAFGMAPPQYAHIPLILNGDGSKMSKRDVGAAVGDYPRQGFLADGVVNFLALLGWSSKTDEEIFRLEDLVERFSLDAVNRAPARFDAEKCAWINQQHLMAMEPDAFVSAVRPFASEAGQAVDDPRFASATRAVQRKVRLLGEVPAMISFLLDDEFPVDDGALANVAGKAGARDRIAALIHSCEVAEGWNPEVAQAIPAAAAADAGGKPGEFMLPMRVALSGSTSGPDLIEVMVILGRDRCLARLRRFADLIAD